MYAVILAGGKGKRFWPFSTSERPKQFLDITGKGSMLAVTFDRISRLVPKEKILLLTARDQVPIVRKELPSLDPENIFAEPEGRNTAPSLAAAAAMVRSRGSDEPVLCCPSDHLIEKIDEFEKVVKAAAGIAGRLDVLVTFGIVPEGPATGYGYIESGKGLEENVGEVAAGKSLDDVPAFRVKRFHEKPERKLAESYVERAGFYWNAGIFMWRPSVFLSAWSEFLPEGADPLEKIEKALGSDSAVSVIDVEYLRMPSTSVDFGILEKADNVVVIPSDLGWNDVGSWDALADILPLDGDRNAGTGNIVALDSRGNIFFNPEGRIAAVGVDDLVVAVNDGTVMICRRGESQRVRELLEKIEEKEKNNGK